MEAPGVVLFGAGHMGGALIRGWRAAVERAGGMTLTVMDPRFDRDLENALDSAGVVVNPPQPAPADAVVLAVKPDQLASVAGPARAVIGARTVVISIMAGVTLDALAAALAAPRVVRAMPNVAGQIGHGVTAYVAAPACEDADHALIAQLLEPLGAVERVAQERQMDVVTAISGSGPAYVFLLTEVLAAAGEAEGLDAEFALRLARRTVAGAGAMLEAAAGSPAELRRQVTSPGGTTQAALDVLQSGDGLAPLLRRAVAAAAQRSRDLGRNR